MTRRQRKQGGPTWTFEKGNTCADERKFISGLTRVAGVGFAGTANRHPHAGVGQAMSKAPKLGWHVVGNIGGVRGQSTGPGTKHFSHGAKVIVQYGDCENLCVSGLHRGSKRRVTMWVRAEHVVNMRVQMVRSAWDGYSSEDVALDALAKYGSRGEA